MSNLILISNSFFNCNVTVTAFLYHSHKKRKDSLETRAVLPIFSLELDISGVAVKSKIKTAKNGDFCEELLGENDFETVLASFCCYDHGVKASEAVQKIATDQLLVCYYLLNSQNILISNKL